MCPRLVSLQGVKTSLQAETGVEQQPLQKAKYITCRLYFFVSLISIIISLINSNVDD